MILAVKAVNQWHNTALTQRDALLHIQQLKHSLWAHWAFTSKTWKGFKSRFHAMAHSFRLGMFWMMCLNLVFYFFTFFLGNNWCRHWMWRHWTHQVLLQANWRKDKGVTISQLWLKPECVKSLQNVPKKRHHWKNLSLRR